MIESMRTLPWRSEEIVAQLRDRIWLYLSPSSTPHQALEAAALLQMDDVDVGRLARLHFLLSEQVGWLLGAVPSLLRQLPTTTLVEEERSHERIRGAVHWQPTLIGRIGTGVPTLVISRPAQRAYQTPENELLVFLLDEIIRLGRRTGWLEDPRAGQASVVRTRVSEATRWSQSRMLASVERRWPTARTIARIRTGRHRRRFNVVLDAWHVYEALIEHLDVDQLREIIENEGLVTRSDATLFELFCLFTVLDGVRSLGWRLRPLQLIEGAVRFTARKGDNRLEIWYQRTPPLLNKISHYGRTLRLHGLQDSVLRPDVVLRHRTPSGSTNWLLIEAKMGTRRDLPSSARAALIDLLAYRRAYDAVFAGQAAPFGLGIAWGAGLRPSESEIMLATPEHIPRALEVFLVRSAA
jgi:hypothetical protein